MMKSKAFWALLAAGMSVISTSVVSAQWADGETLKRMISTAGGRVAMSPPESTAVLPRVGLLGVFKKKSLFETASLRSRASVDARCSSYLVGTSRKRKVLCADSHLCH